MNFQSIFFIVISVQLTISLEVKLLNPGAIIEHHGKVIRAQEAFHIAIKLNLTVLNGNEIHKLKTSFSNFCVLLKENYYTSINTMCASVMEDLKEFEVELENKYQKILNEKSGSGKSKRDISSIISTFSTPYLWMKTSNLEKDVKNLSDENDKIFKIIDKTEHLMEETAKVVNRNAKILDSTIRDVKTVKKTIFKLVETFEASELIGRQIFALSNIKHHYYSRYEEIFDILHEAREGKLSGRLMTVKEFKSVIKSIKLKYNLQHIINTEEINFGEICSLSDVSLFEENNVNYVVISLPLTTESVSKFDLVKLIPIPKIGQNNLVYSVKLNADFFAINTKDKKQIHHLKTLKNCKEFKNIHVCYEMNDFFNGEEDCISQIIDNNGEVNEFGQLNSCNLIFLKSIEPFVLKLHQKNSYIMVSHNITYAIYSDRKNSRESVVKIFPGSTIIHSNDAGTLKFSGGELIFSTDTKEIMKYENKFSFRFYNYNISTTATLKKGDHLDLNDLKQIKIREIIDLNQFNEVSSEIKKVISEKKEYSSDKWIILGIVIFFILIVTLIIFAACSCVVMVSMLASRSNDPGSIPGNV
jgi:hypothetical protein